MSIRKCGGSEKFSPSYVANGDKVTANFGLRFNIEGERYILTSVFDFTGVTRQELLEMASKGEIVGDVGRRWRLQYAENRGLATTKNSWALVNVRGLLDSPKKRSSAPAVVKANKLMKELVPSQQDELISTSIAAMSPERRKALLALLQAA